VSEPQNQKWLPVALIAGGLAVWGVLLGVGAYLAPAGQAGRDLRKLWVVAGATAVFLLLWGVVLAIQVRKFRRRREASEAAAKSATTLAHQAPDQ